MCVVYVSVWIIMCISFLSVSFQCVIQKHAPEISSLFWFESRTLQKIPVVPAFSNVQYVNHCCKCQDLRECHCRWLPHGKSYIMCSAKWTSNRLEVYYTNVTFQTNKFCKRLLGQSNCNHVIQWMLSIHHAKCFLIPVS